MEESIDKLESGLEGLIGKRVTLFNCRFIYTGQLIEVNEKDVKLSDGGIVFDTGDLTTLKWDDYQPMPGDWYVTRDSMESYGLLKGK